MNELQIFQKKAAICAALVGIAAISIGMSRPAADTHQVETVYTVQPGDTWWSIVEHFRDLDAEDRYVLEYKQELERINEGIDFGNLTPGQTLRIQYHRRDGDHHSSRSSTGSWNKRGFSSFAAGSAADISRKGMVHDG